MEIKGIDISYCQKGMDISKAKAAGVKFCIIRAGYSVTEDNTAKAHINACKANGVDIGYYWYSYAKTVADAQCEAAACLKFLKNHERPNYPVWFDAEESNIAEKNGRETTTDIALAFISEIEKGGYPAGLYANPAYLEQYYNKSRIVGKVDIWLAHWTESPDIKSRYRYGQTMWQWGLDKSLNGGVDGDLCFVDYPTRTAEFYKQHGSTNTPAPAKPTTPPIPVFEVGDIVQFKGGGVYASAETEKAAATKGASRCKVTLKSNGAKHPYHLVSEDGKGVYGWVNASDIEGAEAKPATSEAASKIEVGDIVQFKGGGVYASAETEKVAATKGASRCKVTLMSNGAKHPYHLVSEDGKGVYGWVNASDIEGAETKPAINEAASKIEVGDIVQFKGGSVYMSAEAAKAAATKGASRCKVTIKSNGAKHPYHLVSEDGKGVYGWVDSANIKK